MSVKARLYPNKAERAVLDAYFSHTRLVYNLAVEQQTFYNALRKPPNAAQRSAQLPELKEAFPWLADTPAVALQQVLADFQAAMDKFFKKTGGRPRFKSFAKAHNSFRITGKGNLDIERAPGSGNKYRVRIPKLGWIPFTAHRGVPISRIKSYTATKTSGGRYHIALTLAPSVKKTKSRFTDVNAVPPTGIDVGVVHAIALNDGTLFDFHRPDLDAKIMLLQQRLARTKKGSNRRKKAKQRLARAHAKKAGARKYFIDKATTSIARESGIILLENVRPKSMTASAAGTIEEPGVNVAAKSGLNRGILNSAWGYIKTCLAYKAPGRVFMVPAPYTSQKCSDCQHVAAGNRETRDLFHCIACGYTADADINAARNVAATEKDLWVEVGVGAKAATNPQKRKKKKRTTRKTSATKDSTSVAGGCFNKMGHTEPSTCSSVVGARPDGSLEHVVLSVKPAASATIGA